MPQDPLVERSFFFIFCFVFLFFGAENETQSLVATIATVPCRRKSGKALNDTFSYFFVLEKTKENLPRRWNE